MDRSTVAWVWVVTVVLLAGCGGPAGADVSAALAQADRPAAAPAAAADGGAVGGAGAPSDSGAIEPAGPAVAVGPALPAGPAVAAAAAGAAGKADPVAQVNGQPISRERLADLLIEAHGKQMLQLVVALEAVRQQAAAKKITITPADIAAEEVSSFPEELKDMPPAERENVLGQYLERNNLTRVHWRLAMERQAYLRKLAEGQLPAPQDEDLQDLFRRAYGAKVEVLHIQVDSADKLREAKQRLAKGEDFGVVAREMSTNRGTAMNGGRLKPFDIADEGVPKEIRESAFALEKPGRDAEVVLRDHYHLIRLVRHIPPEDKKFEDARDELTRKLRDQMVRVQMNYLLRSLPAAASIDILDPVIKRQVEQEQPDLPAPTAPGKGG